MSATETVTISNDVKQKVGCYLTDPSRTIKVKLWEVFINDVQEGNTSTFTNIRVIKE